MLNINTRLNWLIILLLLTISTYSQATSLLTQEIDNILEKSCLSDEKTSVSIVAMPSGRTIYAYNTIKPLLAASVTKIITTAAALHYLSPEYRFKTKFLYTGQIRGSVLQGDLIIRAGGDPKLATKDLWEIATQIKASGIRKITGNLIVDAHFFDRYDRAPAWKTERSQRAYDAKLSALSLNYNSIAVHVQPREVGQKLNVWLEPALPYMYIENTAKTIKRGRNTISVSRSEPIDGQVKIQVKGKLPISVPTKTIYRNVNNPMRYASETFRALLRQVGVSINGQTKIVFTPSTGKELSQHLSAPLSMILKELNTFSNNMMAEHIIKTIAAERLGGAGSHVKGLRLVKEFLRQSRVNLQGVNLVDGSGLSRQNRMTTRAITDLLTTMYSRLDIGPDFMSSLRVMGAYGVLSKRLTKSPARGKVRAKTGSLKGVSTLAGYIENKTGQQFAFALFLNNNRCGYSGADKVEDRIIAAIYQLTLTHN
jgi:D-alanyl-D-alanine carboxypeptidase/D-alanyl-D-alanine-endopeptidase (penicillin-binding protein 4)